MDGQAVCTGTRRHRPPELMDEQARAAQAHAAADGDQDALQRLIVHYHATLRGTVERAIDPALRAHLDPDDVLQEAYITAFKRVGSCNFDGPGGFYKWLETIALNAIRPQQRALRSQKRDVARNVAQRPRSATSYPDLLHRLASPDSTPSRRVARHEATAAVLSALARLTDDQRAVIRLRILEDLPGPEVAAALGKSEAAVHMLTHRALKQLRHLLVSITRYLSHS